MYKCCKSPEEDESGQGKITTTLACDNTCSNSFLESRVCKFLIHNGSMFMRYGALYKNLLGFGV